jgi:hypothetical protein
MSQRWISKNIGMAVKDPAIVADIRHNQLHVYSRHIFFTPFYLPSAAQHLLALKEVDSGAALHKSHECHSIPTTHRHDEREVKLAVNTKLKNLKLPLEP